MKEFHKFLRMNENVAMRGVAWLQKTVMLLFLMLLIGNNAWAQTTRYWVGNAGDSNWATATNWDLVSGGNLNPGVPANTDTVIFDENSFLVNQTVAMGAVRTCATMIWRDLTVNPVFDMGTFNLTITGSVILDPHMTIISGNTTALFSFTNAGAGKIFKTSNVNIPRAVTFNNATGDWTIQDSLKTSGTVTVTNGSLNLAGNYLSCPTLTLTLGTLNMDGSTVVCAGTVTHTNGYLTMKGANLQCNTFTASANNAK